MNQDGLRLNQVLRDEALSNQVFDGMMLSLYNAINHKPPTGQLLDQLEGSIKEEVFSLMTSLSQNNNDEWSKETLFSEKGVLRKNIGIDNWSNIAMVYDMFLIKDFNKLHNFAIQSLNLLGTNISIEKDELYKDVESLALYIEMMRKFTFLLSCMFHSALVEKKKLPAQGHNGGRPKSLQTLYIEFGVEKKSKLLI